MARKQGTVESIETKATGSGKTYYRVQINGQWYSSWEYPKYIAGQTVEFDEIVKGNFKNMANVEVADGASSSPATTSSKNAASNVGVGLGERGDQYQRRKHPDEDARIIRQNATSTAVSLVGISKMAGKQDIESLLGIVKDTAKRIYHMNMHGYDAPVVPEAASPSKEVGADVLFQD